MQPTTLKPTVLWLTGYSGAGKTTIATHLAARLDEMGRAPVLLDGDQVRRGLNSDLGFSDADRSENVRRVAEVARLLVDAGLIVIVALISPLRRDRDMVRAKFAPGTFVEVFIDTPLEIAEARDVKGLYRRARAGQLPQFTGVDSVYELPLNPDVRIDTVQLSADAAAKELAMLLLLRRSESPQ
jgi:bifunctional enzyme CysN/CysC